MPDFNAKMHQNRFRLGLRPDPAGRAYGAPPDPLYAQVAFCAKIVAVHSWNDERAWERPRINQVTLSFLLLLMLLVRRAPGSSSTEFEISGLFHSDLMNLNELDTAYCRIWIPLAHWNSLHNKVNNWNSKWVYLL